MKCKKNKNKKFVTTFNMEICSSNKTHKMKKQLLMAALALFTVKMFSQVTVTGGSTATYSNVNAAFAAINAGTHTGAITIDITASTTEPATPTPLVASGQGAASYSSIIIRPTVTATISGAPVSGRGILEFDGADNVTLNGDVSGGPVGKDLSIIHNGVTTLASTACVRLIGRTTLGLGATNFSMLNCMLWGNSDGTNTAAPLTSAHCFYAGTNAVNLTTGGTGDNYDGLTISNNEFKRAYYAIYVGNTTTNLGDNALISNNIIGSANPSDYIHFRGVHLTAVNNATVTGNDINNLTVLSSVNNAGIEINGTTSNNVLISANKIYDIHSESTGGWGAYGINMNGGTNHTIINNVIYDIFTTNYSATSTTYNAFGIRLTSGTGYKVYYNSVNLFGTYSVTTSFTGVGSSAFVVTSTAVSGDIKNNIFCNQQTSSAANVTVKRFMSVWMPTGYNFANMTFNNNAYMVSNANTTDYFIGKVGTTTGTFEYQNLSAWQAASQVGNASNDVNSVPPVNGVAPFISNTNLDFTPNTITPIESGALTTTITNVDYQGSIRPKAGVNPNTNPDIGAYEFDGLAGVATDAGVSALTSPATNGCYGAAENLVVTIKNYGTASVSNIPVTVVVSGAATQTSNATYTGTLAAGASVNFTVATLNMLTAGTYSFNAYTTLAGDLNVPNDAMSTATRTVFPISTIPTTVDFTLFSGANLTSIFPLWSEATGSVVPTGTTSAWTSQLNLNGSGNVTARINMYGTIRNEWLVGPKFTATSASQITFDAAITAAGSLNTYSVMGSDDKILVMVSTDCGVSYAPVYTVSATHSLTTSFTNIVVPFGSYAGQNIIVAFKAVDGPIDDLESYDFHLDNINLYNALPIDAGVTALTKPGFTGCYGSAENMVVIINNYGSTAVSNIPVTVLVSGATTQTTNATYTGTIAPATSASFTVGTLNMTTAGVYSFKAFTSLTGDGNANNDSMAVATRTVIGPTPLPTSVNFTGYNGSNLTALFPLWSEATGSAVATGTTSSWLNQSNLNGAGNITARVNLYGTIRNEWIVGPKFSATPNSMISFDAAITAAGSINTYSAMGSDDMVRVMVSTDCGLSYSPVFTVSATNSLTTAFSNFVVNLSSYAGQDIIVAFLAQDGPIDNLESYDFHLDNINIYNASPTDAGVTSILSPPVGTCYTASEPVAVSIRNFGSASISNVPVIVNVGGVNTQTINGTFPGPLASGATVNFTVGTANMSIGGVYTFTAYTTLAGDLNTFNDVAVANRTVNPIINILGNTVLCIGDTTTVTAGGTGTTYTWSTGANTSSIVISPSVSTVYTLTASDGVCTSSKIATVTVNNPTITANNVAACAGTTASLTATAFAPISWYSSPTATTSIATGNTYTTIAVSNTTVYAEAQSSATGTINATMAAGNGSSGNMFDVVAVGNIEVNGVDVHISSTAVTTVEVWYRPGSFVGFESSNAGWTNVLTTTVTGMGTGNLTYIPINFAVPIPAGQTYGFYVTANGGGSFAYTNGTAVGNIHVQNSDLQILEGKGGSYFGVTISTRIWNGQMRYTKVGCTSPRIPVTMSVSPSPTVTVVSSNTNICAGQSATLIANGGTTYNWNTGATTQGIIVTPSVTTTYTVTGSNGVCSSSAIITQSVSTCTAIDFAVAANNGVIVYPNPSGGNVSVIVVDVNNSEKIEVLDALGKLILSKKLVNTESSLDLSNLANGVYMYRIVNSNGIVKQGKLVKE